eukprot:scaffold3450_cov323-Prasinococcus_capsulatus_cf.AAC.11
MLATRLLRRDHRARRAERASPCRATAKRVSLTGKREGCEAASGARGLASCCGPSGHASGVRAARQGPHRGPSAYASLG